MVENTFFEKLSPMGYQERNVLQSEVYEHLTPTCAPPPVARATATLQR